MRHTASPEGRATGKRDVKERVRTELQAYAITALYLYVWLVALLLYKTALLREEGVSYLPLGLAAGKALILGKFVLLGESFRIGARLRARTLLQRIAWKVVALFLLVVLLSVLEEFVVGWAHGRSPAQTLAEYEARSILELGATCLLMLLVLVPFVATKQISLALGPGVLRRMLLTAEERAAAPERRDSAT
jgi:hypothetical protein